MIIHTHVEPRVDDNVDMGLIDDALDDTDYDEDVGQLDRADDTAQHADSSDRRVRCRKLCRRGYTLSPRYRCRCVPRNTAYMYLGGTRHKVTPMKRRWRYNKRG